jgi:hypothetical protein
LANDEELKVAVLEGTEPVGQNGNRKSPSDLMIPHDCRLIVKEARTQTEICATAGSFEEFLEFGFGKGGYTQFLGFIGFGAGIGTNDDIVGFFADRTGDFAAVLLN